MKVKYDLTIHERDDYFFGHNTFSCKAVEVEQVIECKTIHLENGVVKKEYKHQKLKVKDKIKLVSFSSLFDSVKSVICELKNNYKEVHEDDYYLYLLDKNGYNKVVCIQKPQKHMGYGKDVIKIYDEYIKGNS